APPSRAPLFPYTALFRSEDLDVYPQLPDATGAPTLNSEEPQRLFRVECGWRGGSVGLAGSAADLATTLPSGRSRHVPGDREDPRSEEHTSELQSRFELVC